MTETQKELVQKTWRMVVPIADKAAEMFYNRLFEIMPDVKPLFNNDIKAQGGKLMKTITVAVGGLDDLEGLVPILQELGIKHIDYGVKSEHYAVVGEALLWTLERGLGPEFTPEVKSAWEAVYGVISTTMIEAAEQQKQTAAA